ncbi:hypothetical protein PpBr36_06919 [Pyricularia pennisetigena]|uniref:hypothetical protein n=1 Tax=Pyricularia pennisetigena TaxID=1578925 RepID=UPI001152469A|nr:hypothetical protein PpBr36_06919 [Pyricularia pennisetigena]TLS25237.1 hypothetical protein PpBr36_06919 [Pyricularia pennisetigena]
MLGVPITNASLAPGFLRSPTTGVYAISTRHATVRSRSRAGASSMDMTTGFPLAFIWFAAPGSATFTEFMSGRTVDSFLHGTPECWMQERSLAISRKSCRSPCASFRLGSNRPYYRQLDACFLGRLRNV